STAGWTRRPTAARPRTPCDSRGGPAPSSSRSTSAGTWPTTSTPASRCATRPVTTGRFAMPGTSRRSSRTTATARSGGRCARVPALPQLRVRKVRAVERWFQNTRGLVIVILAVATCALLLAVEPSDGFPTGVGVSSDGGDGGGSATVTTGTTTPGSTTPTLPVKPTLQQGSTD